MIPRRDEHCRERRKGTASLCSRATWMVSGSHRESTARLIHRDGQRLPKGHRNSDRGGGRPSVASKTCHHTGGPPATTGMGGLERPLRAPSL